MKLFDEYLAYTIAVICLILVVIALIIILAIRKAKKKRPHINIDESYINELINKFGSYDNIVEIGVDGNKLKVSVKNLKVVDLDGIKQMASSGVFVSGNNIKSLFKYDADILKDELEKYKKGMN